MEMDKWNDWDRNWRRRFRRMTSQPIRNARSASFQCDIIYAFHVPFNLLFIIIIIIMHRILLQMQHSACILQNFNYILQLKKTQRLRAFRCLIRKMRQILELNHVFLLRFLCTIDVHQVRTIKAPCINTFLPTFVTRKKDGNYIIQMKNNFPVFRAYLGGSCLKCKLCMWKPMNEKMNE